MCLFPRFSLGRDPRRAGVCRAAADNRTVRLMYVTISRVPAKCSCNTQTRGSARPSALQDQVTPQASILRGHLQNDREPRPTKLLRPTPKLTPMRGRGIARQSKTTAGILLPRAAHPVKIHSGAAIPASDLVH